MVGRSGSAPRQRISGATLSLFSLAYSELRNDVALLLDTRWDEPVRRRAEELSSTLAQACQRQGFSGLLPLLRSTTNLARLSKTDALPVLPALREKLDWLMREIEKALPRRPGV